MTDIIRTRLLSKSYGMQDVVTNVTMRVKKGEIYGFLGPNGAGKSTLMKMLLNLAKPTGGEIVLFGERLAPTSTEPLKRIGHMIEAPVFYEKLTAEQNLGLHAEYMGCYRAGAAKEALELVQLVGIENKQVKQFSLGMRQRLGIARAIMTRPELLLLDEPINGLDPEGIQEMRVLFKRLRDEYGTTMLVSSHLLAEVEQVADTIGVIDHGRLIQEVSMESIRRSKTEYVEITTSNAKLAAVVLEDKLKLRNFKLMGGNVIRVYDASVTPEELSKGLVLNDVPVESINRRHHSLEEYFLELTRGGGSHATFDQT
ncbi:MAG: bacitracin transporter ATP-binding protein, partial [Paenibacillus sp.]|nr:bacitracin transporter ATP-binding protein [Paenibacillus sp.]